MKISIVLANGSFRVVCWIYPFVLYKVKFLGRKTLNLKVQKEFKFKLGRPRWNLHHHCLSLFIKSMCWHFMTTTFPVEQWLHRHDTASISNNWYWWHRKEVRSRVACWQWLYGAQHLVTTYLVQWSCRLKISPFSYPSCKKAPFDWLNISTRLMFNWVKTDGVRKFWLGQFGHIALHRRTLSPNMACSTQKGGKFKGNLRLAPGPELQITGLLDINFSIFFSLAKLATAQNRLVTKCCAP